MARPPFDLLRACFMLLAAVILTELAAGLLGGAACFWLNITTTDKPGECMPIAQMVREQWSEILAAILALLLAAKPKPPDKE